MSLDDLDEKLFADELHSTEVEKHQQPTTSGSNKRRNWLWKHAFSNSLDEDDIGKTHSSTSLESSRRGSICSNKNSPNRSPFKKNKDQRKVAGDSIEDGIKQRQWKDTTEIYDSVYNENKLNASTHLYSVLEEQALGEAVQDSSESLYTGSSTTGTFSTTIALSTNIWY